MGPRPLRTTADKSIEDVSSAYIKLGYTSEHAELLAVEAADGPDDYILNLHKAAMTSATSSEKAELCKALTLIGLSRHSVIMQRLGNSGQTILTVDEAYSALSAPKDSIDDGLIM